MPHCITTSNGTYYMPMATTTATTSTTVFSGWISTAATTTSATIWTVWSNETTTWYEATAPIAALSAADQAAQDLRMAARREQARIEQVARRRAQRRALATLLRFIAPQQRDELRRLGHFHVQGGATGRTYRIKRGRIANIDVLNELGAVVQRLCAHPAPNVPDSDTMLAQALHLQSAANEEQFVRTANVHPLR